MDKNKVICLDHLSILKISGEGAFDLLQGQITCDVDKVTSANSALGALCNAKGRIISSFIFCLLKKKSYALISSKETLNHTRDELKKYSPFYEVEIKFDSSFNFYGIEKTNFSNIFQEEISNKTNTILIDNKKFITYLNKKFLLVVCDKKESSQFKALFNEEKSKRDWNLDEILCMNVEISQEISEKYTPHELNYDLNNRVDFEKGCYTGQEIVARMQYRGKNLPRLILAESTDPELKENMIIENKENKKVGNLVKVVNFYNKSICLISTKEKNTSGSLKVREKNSFLTIS